MPQHTFRNTDVNVSPSEGSEGSEKHCRENIYDLRKYLNCHEQTVDRYVNFKCATGEDLDGKEEHGIRSQKKDGPCKQRQKAYVNYVLQLCGTELLSYKLGCLKEDISKKNVGVTSFFHAGYSKMGEEKDKLREYKNEKNAVKSP